MYAVFDLGAVVLLGGPDRAALVGGASHGRHWRTARHAAASAAMMIEYGERFWGDRWNDLYDVLGGNPLAAMPSLHFATSLMAAHLLSEVGPGGGRRGLGYAATLGLALVYLGEHYAIDLIAGAALAEAVRTGRTRGRAGHRASGRALLQAAGGATRRQA